MQPGGADKFITADGQRGRMVEVITSGEPALMFGHWTGIYFNGYELGFKILEEVVQRLHKRFDNRVKRGRFGSGVWVTPSARHDSMVYHKRAP